MSLFDGSSSVQHTERKGKPIGQQVRHFLLYRIGHILMLQLLLSALICIGHADSMRLWQSQQVITVFEPGQYKDHEERLADVSLF